MQNTPKTGRLLNHNHVFLTGATGVLGAYVLKELLLETDSKIYCLIRAESDQQALERVSSVLKVYDPEGKTAKPFQERVIPLLGDITDPQLGLSAERYEELTRQIDVTLHVAACTNLLAEIKSANLINVGGTHNVIEFALKTPQRYLAYVSSYSVLGDKTFVKDFIFKEADFNVGQGFRYFPYQETKFFAEKSVRQAGEEKGLVWNIFRPGQIYGDSATGAYPFTISGFGGLFYDLFKNLMYSGVLPHSNWMYDISPVDYVSKAFVFLALNRPSYFETYHLTNPDIKPFHESFCLLRDAGYPLRLIPVEHFLNLLIENGHNDGANNRSIAAKVFGFWYKVVGFNFKDSAYIDASYTAKVLQLAGIVCPKIDQRLISTYVKRGIQDGYFPPPPQATRQDNIEKEIQTGTDGAY